MPRPSAAALLALTLAACVPAPRPVPSPAPAPRAVGVVPIPPPRSVSSPPVASDDWRDALLTPGDWHYEGVGTGTRAAFGAGLVDLSCDRSTGGVVLRLRPGAAGPTTLRTSSATHTLVLAADGSARLAARDPLLDAIAFSRGRFVIDRTGSPPLVVPVDAEIGRVIEDCR